MTAPLPAVRDHSRAVMANHARTFNLAALLLPPDARDDAAVVYAFCRHADDTVDEADHADVARAQLTRLRAELAGSTPARPLVAGFLEVCERRGLPVAAAEHLLDGMESDLEPVRVPHDAALMRYCYQAAGTVGLLMQGVIGVTDPAATPHALDLGIGMQLTNICRDVLEDAARGRVYLPADRLAAAGTSQEALLEGHLAGVDRVVADLLNLAEAYYRSGERGMAAIPWRARVAIWAAARMYRAIGRRILARPKRALTGRTEVPRPHKLAHVAVAVTTAHRLRHGQHDPRLHEGLAGLPGARA